jgi:serine/threonine protein kinase
MSKYSTLIASGSYGCVVLPPINDNIVETKKKYKNPNKDDVGKVFKKSVDGRKEAVKEFKQYMDTATNIKNYSKIVPKIKGYTIHSGVNNNNIEKCINNSFSDENIHQIIYENAGLTFYDYPKGKLTYKKFINMLKVFFKDFYYYVEAGKIHSDINYGNIMIKDNKILLIDFGLEKTKDNIFDRNKGLKYFKYKYIFYPPEFRLLYFKKLKNDEKTINYGFSNLKDLIKYYDFNIMTKKYILKEIHDLINNFNVDYKKFDIYALGINLFLIRNKILFVNDEIDKFNYLIKKMMEPNPNKRFSILEIINYAS